MTNSQVKTKSRRHATDNSDTPTYKSASGHKGTKINDNLQAFKRLESSLRSKDSLNPVYLFGIMQEQATLLQTLRKDVDENIKEKTKDKNKAKDTGNPEKMKKSKQKLDELKLVLKDINSQSNELMKNFLKAPQQLSQSKEAQEFINSYMESMYLSKSIRGLLDTETIKLLTKLEGVNLKSGTIKEAIDYIYKQDFTKWLDLPPAKRLLISSFVSQAVDNLDALLDALPRSLLPESIKSGQNIQMPFDKLNETPAYQMALSYTKNMPEIREYTRRQWQDTLTSSTELDSITTNALKKEGYNDEQIENLKKQHKFGKELLRKLFVLMHEGLKERTDNGDYQPWTENMATALSHGGRINIRIPALNETIDNPFDLTDWLGITVDGKMNSSPENGKAIFKRSFGTHYLTIDNAKGIFEEKGGQKAAVRAKLNSDTQLFGLNLAAGGFGKQDYNGKVIVPDGSHGHMFIGFRKPTAKNDGGLQIGVETTGPGVPSMVGYKHNMFSSEKTANPLSSFGGSKDDKHGVGKLDWNRVTLSELDSTDKNSPSWLNKLKEKDDMFQLQRSKGLANIYTLLGTRDEFEKRLNFDGVIDAPDDDADDD
ncbi:MAG: hypothetical protein F6K21_06790 [Symploca sp. SIO2D2]|nr:hypothetical protein [Symploca sp. SIO2D2]